jgi:hypothetical protein
MTREARSCRRCAHSRRAPFIVVLGLCEAAVDSPAPGDGDGMGQIEIVTEHVEH